MAGESGAASGRNRIPLAPVIMAGPLILNSMLTLLGLDGSNVNEDDDEQEEVGVEETSIAAAPAGERDRRDNERRVERAGDAKKVDDVAAAAASALAVVAEAASESTIESNSTDLAGEGAEAEETDFPGDLSEDLAGDRDLPAGDCLVGEGLAGEGLAGEVRARKLYGEAAVADFD